MATNKYPISTFQVAARAGSTMSIFPAHWIKESCGVTASVSNQKRFDHSIYITRFMVGGPANGENQIQGS